MLQNHAAVATSPSWTPDELALLNARFDHRPPQELLAWLGELYGRAAVLTCSFGGASGMVLLDMVARLGHPLAVVFLDTDLLFPETYALAEAAARRYGITVARRHPTLTLAQQAREEGDALYTRDPDRCCGIRKVAPLADALRPYRAWVSGIRRDQGPTRADTPLVAWSARHNLLKLNPLAAWGERDVWRYIHANDVPYNPLLDQGFSSIGCVPCTRPAQSPDGRSGRWAGFAKTECGIHT